ncbi:unnamed protein product [Tilletia controversa]|nr:unnamed protein product [Tilletia controversa]
MQAHNPRNNACTVNMRPNSSDAQHAPLLSSRSDDLCAPASICCPASSRRFVPRPHPRVDEADSGPPVRVFFPLLFILWFIPWAPSTQAQHPRVHGTVSRRDSGGTHGGVVVTRRKNGFNASKRIKGPVSAAGLLPVRVLIIPHTSYHTTHILPFMDETPVKNALIRIIVFGACNSSRAGDKSSYAKAASIVTLRYTTPHLFNPSTDEAYYDAVDLVCSAAVLHHTPALDVVDEVSDGHDSDTTTNNTSPTSSTNSNSTTNSTSSEGSNSTTGAPDTAAASNNSLALAGWKDPRLFDQRVSFLLTFVPPTLTGVPKHWFITNLFLQNLPGFAQRRLGSMLRLQSEVFEDPELRREVHEYCDLYDGPGGTNLLIAAASQWVNFSVREAPRKKNTSGRVHKRPYFFQLFLVSPLTPYFTVHRAQENS